MDMFTDEIIKKQKTQYDSLMKKLKSYNVYDQNRNLITFKKYSIIKKNNIEELKKN